MSFLPTDITLKSLTIIFCSVYVSSFLYTKFQQGDLCRFSFVQPCPCTVLDTSHFLSSFTLFLISPLFPPIHINHKHSVHYTSYINSLYPKPSQHFVLHFYYNSFCPSYQIYCLPLSSRVSHLEFVQHNLSLHSPGYSSILIPSPATRTPKQFFHIIT